MAPQTDEWWTKVGLLSGLVLVCAVRPLLDRAVPEPKSAADDLRTFAVAPGLAGAALAVGTVLLVGAGIVLAGTPARGVVVRQFGGLAGRSAGGRSTRRRFPRSRCRRT